MKLRNRAPVPTLVERGSPLVDAARDRASSVLDSARPHVSAAIDSARPHVSSAADRATVVLDAARPHVTAAIDSARPHVTHAVDAARDAVSDTVVPAVHGTASRVADVAREDVVPKVSAAVGAALAAGGAALAASEPAREEARARGGAVLAALKGEAVVAPKSKSHKLRKAFGLLTLIAAAGAAWTALQRRRASDPWSVPAVSAAPVAQTAPSASPTAASTTATTSATAPSGDPLLDEIPTTPADDVLVDMESLLDTESVTEEGDVTETATETSLLPDGPDEDVRDLR